jgi:hypothetical protein
VTGDRRSLNPIGGQLSYQASMFGSQFVGALGRASFSRHVEKGSIWVWPR